MFDITFVTFSIFLLNCRLWRNVTESLVGADLEKATEEKHKVYLSSVSRLSTDSPFRRTAESVADHGNFFPLNQAKISSEK